MSKFKEALTEAMTLLAKNPKTLFIGQGVTFPGPMYDSLRNVPASQRLEFPVAENLNVGYATGLSLEGFLPVVIVPRWNFLLLAADQLVNHLDRIPLYSEYRPKVIIRTAVGKSKPLDPGYQHQDDFTCAFQLMFKTIHIACLWDASHAIPFYKAAMEREGSTLLVEMERNDGE